METSSPPTADGAPDAAVAPPTIGYLFPVHNAEISIAATVAAATRRLQRHPGSEIVLVENGSIDGSAAECTRLATTAVSSQVSVIASQSRVGMGCALREAIRLSHAQLLVLTAADLPFGFTDLDACLALDPRPAVVIGSKGHPGSHVETSMQRRVLSAGFTWLRRVALGIDASDTQGTVLIEGDLARDVLPRLRCDDYLITTEVIAWAARLGHRAVEVPVRHERSATSTVSPFRDSMRMAAGLFRLRARLRRGPRA